MPERADTPEAVNLNRQALPPHSTTCLEARKLKRVVELPLHGAGDWVKEWLMKGKVTSDAGIYWPIFPKWGDMQTCIITC